MKSTHWIKLFLNGWTSFHIDKCPLHVLWMCQSISYNGGAGYFYINSVIVKNNNSMTQSCSEDNCGTFLLNDSFVFCVKSVMFYHSSTHHPPIYREKWHHDWRRTRGDTCCSQLSSSVNRGWWNWVRYKKNEKCTWDLSEKMFQNNDRKKLGGSFHTPGGQKSPILNFICVLA